MNTFIKIFLIACTIILLLVNGTSFAAKNKYKKKKKEFSIITNMSSSEKLTLSNVDIQQAIANNIPLETEIIASACVFTNNEQGDFDLSVKADSNYLSNGNFALYNYAIGKIDVDIQVFSSNEPNPINILPGSSVSLTNHANRVKKEKQISSRCANKLLFNVSIAPSDLRKAKAGEYDLSITVYASNYSG